MKTTILIKEKRIQLILEPETPFDKEVLKILGRVPNSYKANFYDCQGGWTRSGLGFGEEGTDSDLVIVFDHEGDKP